MSGATPAIESRFALHETLDLHEVAVAKAVSLTKAKTMQILVTDPELKDLMQQEVELSSRQLEELDGLLANALRQEEGQ